MIMTYLLYGDDNIVFKQKVLGKRLHIYVRTIMDKSIVQPDRKGSSQASVDLTAGAGSY